MKQETTPLPPADWPPSASIAADDMRDSPEQRQQFDLLAPLLEDCEPLTKSFAKWDQVAKKQLCIHSFLLILTAICATVAVVLAIFQLADIQWQFVGTAEFACAAFAGVAVLLGVGASFNHLWRLRRFQAEQSRLIKFGFLLNAAHWLDHREAGREYLRVELERLQNLNRHAPEEWVLRKRRDINPPKLLSTDIDAATLQQLVAYIKSKRIWYQANYFRSEGNRRKSRERMSASLPVVLFAVSLMAVIARYFLHSYSEEAAKCLLLIAACLPVFAAGIRTVRGAMEYARNANRYYALFVQLWEIDQRQSECETAGDINGQMLALGDAELALVSEHRSWQRLMLEAEWFG